MLGIRWYRGVAVDLFQGDLSRFAADVTGELGLQTLSAGDASDARHVAMAVPVEASPMAGLMLVRTFLDGDRPQPAVRRITLVAPSAAVYTALQQALFSLFPEDDEGPAGTL